ncbi:MAG: serine hydrolase [Deltaproteobacteria bacterium]|nr:serine hydrolase [Deltaproteobacteria bacterium]
MKNLLCLIVFSLFFIFGCSPKTLDIPKIESDSSVDADSTYSDSDISDGDISDSIEDAGSDSGDTGVDVQDAQPDSLDSGDSDPDILRDDGLESGTYYEKMVNSTDRTLITEYFNEISWLPPQGAYLLIGKVVEFNSITGIKWFSMGGTGFTYSYGNFWPASTVKLAASVFALKKVAEYGLTGDAVLSFSDDDGNYSGTLRNLYETAIINSDNVSYNRLMLIAGFTEVNDQYLTEDAGYPDMILQRRYTHPFPESDLRHSPEITYSEGTLSGIIPSRSSSQIYSVCPEDANCITLSEMTDILRRVVMDELDFPDSWNLSSHDHALLMDALLVSPDKITPEM